MIESAVANSAENIFINNNSRNDISIVDIEVDRRESKLEQDGDLGRFVILIVSCD